MAHSTRPLVPLSSRLMGRNTPFAPARAAARKRRLPACRTLRRAWGARPCPPVFPAPWHARPHRQWPGESARNDAGVPFRRKLEAHGSACRHTLVCPDGHTVRPKPATAFYAGRKRRRNAFVAQHIAQKGAVFLWCHFKCQAHTAPLSGQNSAAGLGTPGPAARFFFLPARCTGQRSI